MKHYKIDFYTSHDFQEEWVRELRDWLCDRMDLVRIVDTKPKDESRKKIHKKWECHDCLSMNGMYELYQCPKCGRGFLDDLGENDGSDMIDAYDEFNFCPYCGEDLRSERWED